MPTGSIVSNQGNVPAMIIGDFSSVLYWKIIDSSSSVLISNLFSVNRSFGRLSLSPWSLPQQHIHAHPSSACLSTLLRLSGLFPSKSVSFSFLLSLASLSTFFQLSTSFCFFCSGDTISCTGSLIDPSPTSFSLMETSFSIPFHDSRLI
ncbi:hypothetical protein RIF29_29975 [Crotalaria pallida]|uniref:Uncharacterized protein n=1 Tax=Crotalaria pallida TaxID=3830 RepID=A0AAN9HUC8_CROPI